MQPRAEAREMRATTSVTIAAPFRQGVQGTARQSQGERVGLKGAAHQQRDGVDRENRFGSAEKSSKRLEERLNRGARAAAEGQ